MRNTSASLNKRNALLRLFGGQQGIIWKSGVSFPKAQRQRGYTWQYYAIVYGPLKNIYQYNRLHFANIEFTIHLEMMDLK